MNHNQKDKLNKKFKKIIQQTDNIYENKDKIDSNLAFHFVEGNLIKAVKSGDWILIDEINLASNEVLQRLLPLLENSSLFLYDRGDLKEIKRHPDFRIIACMNPGSDVGKKDLPQNIKSKFIATYVQDLFDPQDIQQIISSKIENRVNEIQQLYSEMKDKAENHQLEDYQNRRPHLSLRNLSRSISYIKNNQKLYSQSRVVYDGLYLGFGSALNSQSLIQFHQDLFKITQLTNQDYLQSLDNQQVKNNYIDVYGFYLQPGQHDIKKVENLEFLVTPSFKKHIIGLLRAISNCDLPVLLEGPTSSGKTSVVKFLAELTGNKCVRINNHQHTDIEEYIGINLKKGTYLPDNKGRLVFTEGVLIEALRNGHWIILDELNLARSEILESLNRLLDDNKELFINETQEYIKPAPGFRIFATQNPSSYGGRKELSKAFKNRFIQLYFDDIQDEDLLEILQKRCKMPLSFSKKILSVTKDLKILRQQSNFFMGKEGVVTVRDLIKWGQRDIKTKEDLAYEGYFLLAERLRTYDERLSVKKIIEKNCQCVLEVDKYYQNYQIQLHPLLQQFKSIQLNNSFERMITLAHKAIIQKEPVLLVGDTGCGKTTVCQILSQNTLLSVNCHKNTESSDFLGSLRPLRNKASIQEQLNQFSIETQKLIQQFIEGSLQFDNLIKILSQSENQINMDIIRQLLYKHEALFEWQDGPLIQAMQEGKLFLIDEISLAEDSVLERLNSVLEPEKTLLLPEKGGKKADQIVAQSNFIIVATMNPGGDFGKRELSPALRNRFTEIWVESLTSNSSLSQESGSLSLLNLLKLSVSGLNEQLSQLLPSLMHQLILYMNMNLLPKFQLQKRFITMRDIQSMLQFFRSQQMNWKKLYCEGVMMVIEGNSVEDQVYQFIKQQVGDIPDLQPSQGWGVGGYVVSIQGPIQEIDFCQNNPTTNVNLQKLLRAMQLDKAILQEGEPGCGKSSLVEYVSAMTGNSVYKITLSEHTDLIDLLGSDLPEQGTQKVQFKWHDGILLKALKLGHWILLDELNLATQSVLEGLNAILDHRGTVFIPEMNQAFEKHPNFRIFACQNPMHYGGGRKGLPSSFLNRFTKIQTKSLNLQDYGIILNYWGISDVLVQQIISFLQELQFQEFSIQNRFNLRDLKRFVQVYKKSNLYSAVQLAFIKKENDPQIQKVIIQQIFNQYKQIEILSQKFFKDYKIPDYQVKFNSISKCLHVVLPSQLEILNMCLICLSLQIPLYINQSQSLPQLIAHQLNVELEQITINEDIYGSFEQNENGSFQWYNSQVIEKYQNGGLLVLKGANTKLYPILEKREISTPGGVIKCHSQFQIIITGNVSNGIKNRCVEINTKRQIGIDQVEAYFRELQFIQIAKQQTQDYKIQQFMSHQLCKIKQEKFIYNDYVSESPQYLENSDSLIFQYGQDQYGVSIFEKQFQNQLKKTQLKLYLQPYSHFLNLNNISKVLQNYLQEFIKQLPEADQCILSQMPKSGKTSDQIQNLKAQLQLMLPKNISPSHPLYQLTYFEPQQKALVQYNFLLQNQRNLIQALFFLQERETQQQFQIDTQSLFQMSRSKDEHEKKLQIQQMIIQWKHLGGQGNPYQIFLTINLTQMNSDFEQELNRIRLDMNPIIQNSIIKVYDEFDNYNILKEIPVLKTTYSLQLYLENSQFNPICQQLDYFFTLHQQPKILQNLTMDELTQNQLEKRYWQMFYQLKKDDQMLSTSVKIKDIFIFQKIQQQMDQNINNILKDDNNYRNEYNFIYNWIYQAILNTNTNLIEQKQEKLIEFQQIYERDISQLQKSQIYQLISQMFLSQFKLSQESFNNVFRAQNEYKYEQIKQQIYLNKHKPQFIYDLIIQNDFKPSKKFQKKYQTLQDKIQNLFTQLIYRGEPVFFIDSQVPFLNSREPQNLQNQILYLHSFYPLFKDLIIPISLSMLYLLQINENQEQIQQIPEFLNSQNLLYFKHFPYKLPLTQVIKEEIDGFVLEEERGVKNKKAMDAVLNSVKDEYSKKTVLENREQLKKDVKEQFQTQDEDLEIMAQTGSLKNKLETLNLLKSEQIQNDEKYEILYSLVKNLDIKEKQPFELTFKNSFDMISQSLKWDKLENLLNQDIPVLDVHQDVSYLACVKINQLFLDLLIRIQQLLNQEEFQSNQVLLALATLVDHITDSKIDKTYLIRLIQGLQLVMEKIFDWNNMVPKKFNIETENLNQTLKDWRKNERKGWKTKTKEIEIAEMSLMNMLIQALKKKQDPQELFKTLEQYLKHSKMGQFAIRIQILQFLQRFYPKQISIMKSLIDFYMNFQEIYENQIQIQKQDAQKDIRECEILVGWDSNNFHILKATVEKFHTKLYKIGKKFKDFLDQSFEAIILTYQNKQLFDSIEQLQKSIKLDDDKFQLIEIKIDNSDQLIKKAQKLLNFEIENYPSDDINNLITTIFERMTALQSPESTKPMKFRALQDLLKFLNGLGFKNHPLSPQLHKGLQMPQDFDVLKINKYYNMIIERIIYMQSRGDYHQDIEKVWIQKGISLMRGGLKMWRQQWDQWLICLKKCNPRVYRGIQIEIIQICDWQEIDKWVQLIVNLERLALNDQQILSIIWNEALQISDLIKEMGIKNVKLDNLSQIQLKCQAFLERINVPLQNKKIQHLFDEITPQIIFLMNQVINCKFVQLNENISDEQIQIITKKYQIATQELHNYHQKLTNLTDKGILEQQQSLIDNLVQISQNLSIPSPKSELQISFVKLIEINLKRICQIHFDYLLSYAKLLYILGQIFCNVFFKGFCHIETSEEKETQGEGIGVGEGKGTEDHTNEIEFEEQMMGLEGEEQDSNQADGEGGMDMEDNDFEGQEKEGEKNDGSENTEQKDLQEEMGDVDDQVDHKMWEDQVSQQEQDQDQDQEQEQQREMDQLDFKGNKQSETEQRAQQNEKEKAEQRNLSDFEEISQENPNEKEPSQDMMSNDERSVNNNPEEKINSQEENDQSIKFSEQGEISDSGQEDNQMEEEFQDPLNKEEATDNEQKSINNDDFEKIDEEEIMEQEDENMQQVAENNQQNGRDGLQTGNDSQQQQIQEDQDKKGENNLNEQDQKDQNQGEMNGQQQNQDPNCNFSQEFISKIMEKSQNLQKDQIKDIIKDLNVQNQNQDAQQDNQPNNRQQEYETTTNQQNIATQLSAAEQNQQMDIEELIFLLRQLKEEQQQNTEQPSNQQQNPQNSQKQDTNQQKNQETEKNQNQEQKQFNFKQNQKEQKNKTNIFEQQNEMEIEDQNFNLEIHGNLDFEKEKQQLEKNIIEYKLNAPEISLQKWRQMDIETRNLSSQLSEELKSVLEATKISQFKGDYKSGKRLNMKKIIPFIASNFRKDKIWLRRTQPNNRNYQIMIAIDDSLSMQENDYGYFALKSSIVLGLALAKAEVGQLSVAAIQNGLKIVHDFDVPFDSSYAPYLLDQFSFSYSDKNSADLSIPQFMRESINLFISKNISNEIDHQICFIISDGLLNKKIVKPLVQEAVENNILYIFIILDSNEKIMNIRSVQQHKDASGKIQTKMMHYLEDFPFKHYMEINDLSRILIEILRQYFEMNKI